MVLVVDSVLAAVRADQLGPQLPSEDALDLAVFSKQLRAGAGDRGVRQGSETGEGDTHTGEGDTREGDTGELEEGSRAV